MPRWPQVLLWATFIPWCWLAMMAVHELGHVLAAWGSGGTITQVVLHPLAISRTDVDPNPWPLFVVWSGPILGIILPLLAWSVMSVVRLHSANLARFFSGFCLLANGLYLGVGSFDGVGDAGDLLRLGTPIWGLWLFGLVTVPLGLFLWHGTGPAFGLGSAQGAVEPRLALASLLLLLVTLVLELSFSAQV